MDGIQIPNKLEVPLKRSDNISMMNKKEEQFWTQTVQESVSNVYWEFRDSVDDEGGERLKEECEHFEKMLMGIVKKYDVNA
jgi:hypothetical protein